MWWMLTAARAGACDLASLDLRLADAEAAFVARDRAALTEAVEGVDRELRCLRVVAPPSACARVHFVHALAEFADDPERCRTSLRATWHAEPWFRLPEDVVPAGHALRQLAWQAEEQAVQWTPTARPVRIDGLLSSAVPVAQPFVLQPVTPDGGVKPARRIDVGGSTGERHVARNLRWVGVGVGAVGVGLLGAAASQRAAYFDAIDAGEVERWQPLHDTTNALSIGWAVTGVTAATVFTASFAVK
jgi:hypothetical protein